MVHLRPFGWFLWFFMVNVGKYASPMGSYGIYFRPKKRTIPVLTVPSDGWDALPVFFERFLVSQVDRLPNNWRGAALVLCFFFVLLMDEIPNNHLGWLKPYKYWDNHHPWWCRILFINSINQNSGHDFPWWFGAQWFGFRLDPLMKGIVT